MGSWKKGLIHLHTKFSDGLLSCEALKRLVDLYHYDFAVITDHFEAFKPSDLPKYISEINSLNNDGKSKTVYFPGLEIAAGWKTDDNSSTAHTLALGIGIDNKWELFENRKFHSVGEILDFCENNGILPMPAHEFAYSRITFSRARNYAGQGFCYEMSRFNEAPRTDFYYRGIIEASHEAEDLTLYNHLVYDYAEAAAGGKKTLVPIAYTGSDFHGGNSYIQQRILGEKITGFLGDWFPATIGIAIDQLHRPTWVYFENNEVTEASLQEAIGKGRTIAARGVSCSPERIEIDPLPGLPVKKTGIPEIALEIEFTKPSGRPLYISVFRNGIEITGFRHTYREKTKQLSLNFKDENPLPGINAYTISISGKMVVSPVIFRTG